MTWTVEPEGIGTLEATGLFTVGELDEPIEVITIKELVKAEKINTVIDRFYPLEEMEI